VNTFIANFVGQESEQFFCSEVKKIFMGSNLFETRLLSPVIAVVSVVRIAIVHPGLGLRVGLRTRGRSSLAISRALSNQVVSVVSVVRIAIVHPGLGLRVGLRGWNRGSLAVGRALSNESVSTKIVWPNFSERSIISYKT
jgi:hypothetical protein